MRGAIVLGATLLGIGVGVAGTMLVPPAVEPYLPDLPGRSPLVEGRVLKKQREPDRVLLKVHTEHGSVLATFTRRVAEIDLLVDQGDLIVLRLTRGRPFVEDPTLERVRGPASPAPAGGPPSADRPQGS